MLLCQRILTSYVSHITTLRTSGTRLNNVWTRQDPTTGWGMRGTRFRKREQSPLLSGTEHNRGRRSYKCRDIS